MTYEVRPVRYRRRLAMHDHDWAEDTCIGDPDRLYLCLTCGATRTGDTPVVGQFEPAVADQGVVKIKRVCS